MIENFSDKYFMLYHKVSEEPQQDDFVMHMHCNYEIFCFVSGDAEYVVEGNTYPLQPGCIMLMRNSESHRIIIRSPEKYERYSINFRQNLLKETGFSPSFLKPFHDRPLGEKNLYVPGELIGVDGLSCFRKMFMEMNHLPPKEVVIANLMSLLCALNCAFVNKNAVHSQGLNRIGNELVEYINENLMGDLSLQALSERVHISASQINRIFKEATGSTVYHYILLKRMNLAQEMITNGESAANAAQMCGFRDYSSFFRMYKKHFGYAPTTKKKQIKNMQ